MILTEAFSKLRVLVVPGALSFLAIFAACQAESPTATPTEEPSGTATPLPTPTSTPPATVTPGPTLTPTAPPRLGGTATATPRKPSTNDRFEFEDPDYPTAREIYLVTNVNGGPLLLAYLDASARQTEYSFISTRHFRSTTPSLSTASPGSPNEASGSTDRFLVRTDGRNRFYYEILESSDPDNPEEPEPNPQNIPGLQVIGDGELNYVRLSDSDKWVDVSSLIGKSDFFPGGQEEIQGPIEDALFVVASSVALATFGIFDEERIQEIVERTDEISVLMDFKLESSDSEKIIIAHRFEHSGEKEYEGMAYVDRLLEDIVFTIDAQSGLIVHAVSIRLSETTGHFQSEELLRTEYEMDYSPQSFDFPQLGDASIETDADKIAAVLELFAEVD